MKLFEIEEGDSSALRQVQHILNNLSPPDIAQQIEMAPPKARLVLWELVDEEINGEVLQELPEEMQAEILRSLDSSQVANITEGLDVDDIADILQQLPSRMIPEILQTMSMQDRQRVASILTYDEDTAGGLMDPDIITVRADLTLDVVLRYLRRHEELPDSTDSLFVVNRHDVFIGILPIKKLLTSSLNSTVREVMVTDVDAIDVNMPDSEVAQLFERYDLVSAPVVDHQKKLLGRITIDDVVDVIREDADHSLLGLNMLSDEEETFSTTWRTFPRRALWLGINLITALLAATVIDQFKDVIEKVVALAVLMPIVASMGGVAGSQTLTVVVRGMALGQISPSNKFWLLSKEFYVGAMNGMLYALVLAVIVSAWFDDWNIALIIAMAMLINHIAAATAGSMLPLILKSARIDPALAGSVVLTTVTDVVGFLSFLGLATYFYS